MTNWSAIMALGLAGIISLGFTERVFSAKDARTVKRGSIVAAGLTLLILIPVGMVGITILQSSLLSPFSTIDTTSNSDVDEDITYLPFIAYPSFALNQVPFPIGIALIVAILGASMSTASGGISAISSVISRNLIQRDIMKGWLKKREGLEDKHLLITTRLFIAPIIGAAFLLAYSLIAQPGVNLILAFDIVFAGAWAPLILGLFWRKANRVTAIISLVVGSAIKLLMYFLFVFIMTDQVQQEQQLPGVDFVFMTIVPTSTFICSFYYRALVTQKKDPAKHDVIDYVPPLKDVLKGDDLVGYYSRTYPEQNPIVQSNWKGQQNSQAEMMIKEKKQERFPKPIKYGIIIFYGAIVIGWIIIRIMLGIDIPFYVVSSESMLPSLEVRDMVVIKNIGDGNDDSSFNNLKVGDIIVFKSHSTTSEGKNRTIVHRISEITNDTYVDGDQIRILKTKGDNNPQSYPLLDYPITERDYIGKVIYVIPGAGAFRSFG